MITGLAQKTFLGKYCLYKRMLVSCLLSGFGFILFQMAYHNSTLLAFVSFFMNLSIGSIEVLVNVLLIEAVKEDPKQAVSFSYGIYGLGAVVGPIIVSIFGINTLIICGIWTIFIGIFYIFIIYTRNK
jgi:predicted MFS family arabinose efflux permease